MKRWVVVALGLVTVAVSAQTSVRRGVMVRTDKVAPDVPAVASDPKFPLRVHLLVAKWGGVGRLYHGYGSGNLLEANGPVGFDYGFECGVPFVGNEAPGESYQARWRRTDYELDILMNEAGTDRVETCTLRIAPTERPFEAADTARMVHGLSSSLRVAWRDPGFAYEAPAPDYPVHFHVLDGARTEDNGGDHGWGIANISEPGVQALQGAQYTYDCWRGFLTNSQISGFYQGHWVKAGQELEVLLQRAGSDKVDRCRVRVNLQPQPYEERGGLHRAAATPAAPIVRMPPANP